MKGIIAVDVEATGISPERNRMIEIGAVRPETGEVFRTLIQPGRPLPVQITELTGITDEMLEGAPSEEEAIKAFLDFIGEDVVLLGHNIQFDYSFLVQAIRRCQLQEPIFLGIDTLRIAKILCAELPSKRLGDLCSYFGLVNERAHRAFEDAKVTAEIYECLKAMNREPELFVPVPLFYKAKKTEPMTEKQRSFLTAILKHHHLEEQYSMENLTKSEASRLIDKLLAAHGRVPYRH